MCCLGRKTRRVVDRSEKYVLTWSSGETVWKDTGMNTGMNTGRAGFQPATSSFANIIFVIVEGISKFGIKIRNHPGAFKWGNCSPLLPKEGLGVVKQ